MQGAEFAGWLENSAERWDVHGVFVPERPFDIDSEAARLRTVMDESDGVNLFVSEGAGVAEIVAAMEAAGQDVPRDPFGHVQLDKVNPGRGSPSSSPTCSAPTRCWSRRAATSRAPPPPTTPTWR